MKAAGHITVVGLLGGEPYGQDAVAALARARLVLGSRRHLEQVTLGADVTTRELRGPLHEVLDQVAADRDAGHDVCILASGDPGLFGIVRVLGERFGTDALEVHPAPSSVAVAFARLGLAWDDAAVVSAHGRPLAAVLPAIQRAAKVAVLTSPDSPPEAVGKALLAAGSADRVVAVASRLGEAAEAIVRTDLEGLAGDSFDPMSVLVLTTAEPESAMGLAWGLPESAYEHRDGMITKAEVRAVALGKLALPSAGVLWDVGAGSGSVAIECARLAPGLEVIAIERNDEQVTRIRANAATHHVTLTVVEGAAPAAFGDLPDPDRVFVGGGGLDVLDAALARLRPGGIVVANYAVVDRAVAAHERLGNLVQVSVARGTPVADLGVRLEAENPVFVCWGPNRDAPA